MCSIWANTLRIQKNCVAILPRAKTGYLIVLFSYAKRVTQKILLKQVPSYDTDIFLYTTYLDNEDYNISYPLCVFEYT